MTTTKNTVVSVRGDAYAAAAASDCTSLVAALNRASGMGNALMITPDDFDGHVQVFELGTLRACHVKCRSPMKVDGRDVLDSDWPRSGVAHVIVQIAGTMTVNRLGGSRIDLQPEHWCVISRVGKFWTEAATPVEFVLLVIPAQELVSMVDTLAKLSERTLRASSGAALLFVQLVIGLVAQASTLTAPSRISVSGALIQVMKAAMVDMASSVHSPIAQKEFYRRVCEIIEANVSDDSLSIGNIAEKLRCSKRYLHLIFSRHNTTHTITAYIRHCRLSRCRSELMMQRNSEKSIAEVAYLWGFHDPSYFARVFRREYGVSPREFVAESVRAEVAAEARGQP